MINQAMVTGPSRVNFRAHHSRQKKRIKRLKSFIILFFIIMTIHFFWTNIPAPTEQLIYQPTVVQNGDTLWGLAQSTGILIDTRTLVLKIMSYNSLASSTILPGQIIYIPSLTSTTLASN